VPAKNTLILCYHRVAERIEDPFQLSVRPDNFSAHLEEITRTREPSTLSDLSIPSRRSRVVVTFDDGYSDNLSNALPIATSKGVPITVFVTSGAIGRRHGFWWDRLAALLRSRPQEVRDVLLRFDWETIQVALGASSPDEDLGTLRRHLLPRPVDEIDRVLDDMFAQWHLTDVAPVDARPLTSPELGELASSEMVTIGAHTVDHVRLRGRPPSDQLDTIRTSKDELEIALGRTVSHFAYPFGHHADFDDQSVHAVQMSGFETACTTVPGSARSSTDPYRLPRRLVMDWSRLRFQAQMQRWRLG
jgi:peptidoglycan/xylan/chitin deacetylase (PgdA/CDA1 family)